MAAVTQTCFLIVITNIHDLVNDIPHYSFQLLMIINVLMMDLKSSYLVDPDL